LRAHERVIEWVEELCEGGYTVVLFGSRARGEARIDSDWDLVIIGGEPPGDPPTDLVQAHFATPGEAEELIRGFNTVFVDAFVEGRLICGDSALFARLSELAREIVNGFVRTSIGWVRRGLA